VVGRSASFAIDSNCLVAAVSEWHGAQDQIEREVDRRLAAGETMVLPAHAVVEAFSVLTRLPPGERLTPDKAWSVLETNFVTRGRVAALGAATYPKLLARVASAGVTGRRVYDEVIAETAVQAGASALITLNPKHFSSPPAGLTIVDPTANAE
jgi:predicted nucleic acid-binding protein